MVQLSLWLNSPGSPLLQIVNNEMDKESSVIVNETEIANTSALTVYGNVSRSCDLQISSSFSSQHAQVGISVVVGNMTGLNYIYVERIGLIHVCSDQFVAFMGPLEPCTVYFANNCIQLHFRGDIVLGIHDVTTGKDHLLGCAKDGGNYEDRVDVFEGETSKCKQVKVFSSVIQCVSINHQWWEEIDDTFQADRFVLKPRAKHKMRFAMSCPLLVYSFRQASDIQLS